MGLCDLMNKNKFIFKRFCLHIEGMVRVLRDSFRRRRFYWRLREDAMARESIKAGISREFESLLTSMDGFETL
jgi:hypothetical protein